MNLIRLASSLAVSLFIAGTCSMRAAGESGPPAEILLGMSTALSGPAKDLGKEMQQGVLAGLERVNRAGSYGRKLRLIALDDGYEPARTAPNIRQLVEKEKVLVVIGDVGTPTAIAALPILDEQKTLLLAPFTGAGILRKNPADRYVINFRASYTEETTAMIDALMSGGQLKPEQVAFFTQSDGYGGAVLAGGIAALKLHGLKDEKAIVNARYERNTLAVENAVADILLAEPSPRAVVMVGPYGPCAKFIKLCRHAGFDPIFLNLSFVGSKPLARELGQTDSHVIVTQVVPYPLDESIPIVREFQADLKALDPFAQAGFGDLEGYISARVFARALDKIEGTPSREAIIDALESLGNFDLGLGEPLNLSPTEHQASHRIWPTILKDGAFVPFEWRDLALLLTQENFR